MRLSELKRIYGEEYPAAVAHDGIRLPLHRERRFSRYYHSAERKMGRLISRFMDGSASIAALELQREWHTWDDSNRSDFCQECCWLHEQPDFPDMLRFIMQHAAPNEWSGVAQSVASALPRDEAFDILLRALRTVEIGHSCNIAQAIALTKHPDAEATLRRHLEAVWAHRALWDDNEFLNWVAFDATTCIAHLIGLGAAASDFEERVRQLAQHTCVHNRESCRNYLSKHYTSLK